MKLLPLILFFPSACAANSTRSDIIDIQYLCAQQLIKHPDANTALATKINEGRKLTKEQTQIFIDAVMWRCVRQRLNIKGTW